MDDAAVFDTQVENSSMPSQAEPVSYQAPVENALSPEPVSATDKTPLGSVAKTRVDILECAPGFSRNFAAGLGAYQP